MSDPLLFLTLIILCGVLALGSAASVLIQLLERKYSMPMTCASILFGGVSLAIYRGMKSDFVLLREGDFQSTMGLIAFIGVCAVITFIRGGVRK